MGAQVVCSEQTWQRVGGDGTNVPVTVQLTYDPADPYTVSVAFGDGIVWEFARLLLVVGMDEPVGQGDVRVAPSYAPSGNHVRLALSSPDGNALYRIPRKGLTRFLRGTYKQVPLGQEQVDVDTCIERLLAGRRDEDGATC